MPCSHVKLPDGTMAIVKHGAPRYPRCRFCAARLAREGRANDGALKNRATLLCDEVLARAPDGTEFTCDAPICVACAQHIGEKDFCPKHRK